MATLKTCDVKVKGEVIGQAEYTEFSTLEEAIAGLKDEKITGEQKCLNYVNAKLKQNATSGVRVEVLNDTPERKISRIMRDIRNEKISKSAGAAAARELLASLDQ